MYIKFKFDHSLAENLFYIPDTRWIKALSRLRIITYAINWTMKACKTAKNTTRTAFLSKMYIKVYRWRNWPILCYTENYAESKIHIAEFDSLSNDEKFQYIMLSTHRPLVICLAKSSSWQQGSLLTRSTTSGATSLVWEDEQNTPIAVFKA